MVPFTLNSKPTPGEREFLGTPVPLHWDNNPVHTVVFSRQGGFTTDRNHPNTTTKVSIYHLPGTISMVPEQKGWCGLKLDTLRYFLIKNNFGN